MRSAYEMFSGIIESKTNNNWQKLSKWTESLDVVFWKVLVSFLNLHISAPKAVNILRSNENNGVKLYFLIINETQISLLIMATLPEVLETR